MIFVQWDASCAIDRKKALFLTQTSLLIEKKHRLWFYICGLNITILAGLFSTVFVKLLGKRRRFLAAGLSVSAIGLYTILVGGADAAVVRAALMGALALFARQLGRQQDGLNSLGLVAALMALANPNLLWDVGFQLSFMATLGLVLYATPLTEAFVRLAVSLLGLHWFFRIFRETRHIWGLQWGVTSSEEDFPCFPTCFFPPGAKSKLMVGA